MARGAVPSNGIGAGREGVGPQRLETRGLEDTGWLLAVNDEDRLAVRQHQRTVRRAVAGLALDQLARGEIEDVELVMLLPGEEQPAVGLVDGEMVEVAGVARQLGRAGEGEWRCRHGDAAERSGRQDASGRGD